MICCEADHFVLNKCSSSNKYIYLVDYADDIVITGDDSEGIKALKQHLHQNFQTNSSLQEIQSQSSLTQPYKTDMKGERCHYL